MLCPSVDTEPGIQCENSVNETNTQRLLMHRRVNGEAEGNATRKLFGSFANIFMWAIPQGTLPYQVNLPHLLSEIPDLQV